MARSKAIVLAASTLLALPAVAWLQGSPQDPRDQLARTKQALDELAALQKRVAAGDPQAVAALLAATEQGPADPAKAEAELQELRTRVNGLQEILDARNVWAGTTAPQTTVVASQPGVNPPANPGATVQTAPTAETTAKTAFEAQDFIADRALLGRACWRGGRYQEGIAVLEPLAGNPRADYWRARCLERLSRNTEAVELYRTVVQAAAETPEGRSAREDCEFLEWNMAHGLAKP